MLNQCNFIGRLGQDPESRYTPAGDEIVSMSIACGEKWKDKNGQLQERTEWVNCSVFGKLAGICSQYLNKGSTVYVSGKMQTDKYQDKQTGQDRYSTKIVVRDMKMLDSKSDNQSSNGQANNQQRPQQNQPQPAQQNQGFNDSFDDSIPF